MIFRAGQRVVCIDAKVRPESSLFVIGGEELVEGTVYTVRANVTAGPDSTPAILLEEIRLPALSGPFDEGAFYADRFRPVTERSTETGMAILRKVLQEIKEKSNA